MSRIRSIVKPKRIDALSQQLHDELIIYDAKTHQAHCLNRTATLVWKSCDGVTTVAEMVRSLQETVPGFDKATLLTTLLELQKANLLVEGTLQAEEVGTYVSRRRVIQRVGIVGVVALPVITSIVVPAPAMALSCFPLGHACAKNSDCCSNHCGLLGVNLVCV